MNLDDSLMYLMYVAIEDRVSMIGQFVKLTEEVGELSEIVNYVLGNTSKVPEEPIENEIADVISCALAVLVKYYWRHDKHYIRERLLKAFSEKGKKYENCVMEDRKRLSGG